MSFIIAAAQSASEPGDISRNIDHHLRFGAIAAERGVQLLVFPEGTRTREPPINAFRGGFALMAKRSGAAVQIEEALTP